jgi:hypothetical protein
VTEILLGLISHHKLTREGLSSEDNSDLLEQLQETFISFLVVWNRDFVEKNTQQIASLFGYLNKVIFYYGFLVSQK